MKLFGLVKKINKDIKQKITILIFCSLYVCCLKKKKSKVCTSTDSQQISSKVYETFQNQKIYFLE